MRRPTSSPAKSSPPRLVAEGAGFAAAFAKVGAVMTAFLFPILLDTIGTSALLYGLGRRVDPWRDRHLDVPDRDDGSQSRQARAATGALTRRNGLAPSAALPAVGAT